MLFVFVVKNQVTVSLRQIVPAAWLKLLILSYNCLSLGLRGWFKGEKNYAHTMIFLFFYFLKSYMALKAYPTAAQRKSEHKVSRWGKSFWSTLFSKIFYLLILLLLLMLLLLEQFCK